MMPTILAAMWLMSQNRTTSENMSPEQLLAKAIEARGGSVALTKLHRMREQQKGTMRISGKDIAFEVETLIQLPQQIKMVHTLHAGNQQEQYWCIVNGEEGWEKLQKQPPQPLSQLNLSARLDDLFITRMIHLVDIKAPECTIHAIPAKRVDGQMCVGIKVNATKRPDLFIYFDPSTFLPVKYECQLRDPNFGKLIQQEIFVREFREIQGVKYPHQTIIYHDGNRFIESQISKVELLEKIDEKEFMKPKQNN